MRLKGHGSLDRQGRGLRGRGHGRARGPRPRAGDAGGRLARLALRSRGGRPQGRPAPGRAGARGAVRQLDHPVRLAGPGRRRLPAHQPLLGQRRRRAWLLRPARLGVDPVSSAGASTPTCSSVGGAAACRPGRRGGCAGSPRPSTSTWWSTRGAVAPSTRPWRPTSGDPVRRGGAGGEAARERRGRRGRRHTPGRGRRAPGRVPRAQPAGWTRPASTGRPAPRRLAAPAEGTIAIACHTRGLPAPPRVGADPRAAAAHRRLPLRLGAGLRGGRRRAARAAARSATSGPRPPAENFAEGQRQAA
ncbi:MAG: hypothetical protein MZV63_14155 [Marinilabiliales bacterium]|nr:hypothetical protein [Marinilabiliales bacterium]